MRLLRGTQTLRLQACARPDTRRAEIRLHVLRVDCKPLEVDHAFGTAGLDRCTLRVPVLAGAVDETAREFALGTEPVRFRAHSARMTRLTRDPSLAVIVAIVSAHAGRTFCPLTVTENTSQEMLAPSVASTRNCHDVLLALPAGGARQRKRSAESMVKAEPPAPSSVTLQVSESPVRILRAHEDEQLPCGLHLP